MTPGRLQRVLVLGLVLAFGSPAVADEGALDEAQQVRWAEAAAWLSQDRDGDRVDVSTLRALATRLAGFKSAQLRSMGRYERLDGLPEPAKPRLQHGLRSLAWLIEVGAHLEQGEKIALLLGSDREHAWTEAIVDILREPLGPKLAPVVEALLASEHGVVRAGSGRVVKYLNAFCGGRDSEWGSEFRTEWDPTPLARRVARSLIDDRNPAVACAFILHDAYAFYDKTIVDLLAARLGDERQRPRVEWGLLSGAERFVGDACRFTLDSHWIFYRKDDFADDGLPPEMRSPPERRVTSLPKSDSPADLLAWWKAHRDTYSFKPDAKGWVTVFDGVVEMRPGVPQDIETPYGAVRLHLAEYGETWIDGRPRLTIQLDNEARDDDLFINGTAGSPNHFLGYVSKSTSGSGGAATVRSVMTAPRRAGRVRLRLRYWTYAP